jgi:hypothetical protein
MKTITPVHQQRVSAKSGEVVNLPGRQALLMILTST